MVEIDYITISRVIRSSQVLVHCGIKSLLTKPDFLY